ncbi:hypothetical protein CHCC5023_0824 [Bacillus paralicheniformis]|nr:hypothetical protein CHCC5023_0824 [Bacillus paralicheniformis]TWJ78049.1 hypothetical protein CHCC5019_1170 [Bacillus paralicheniformis]
MKTEEQRFRICDEHTEAFVSAGMREHDQEIMNIFVYLCSIIRYCKKRDLRNNVWGMLLNEY